MMRLSDIIIRPRKRRLDEAKVSELAASMAEVGLLNPVTISTGDVLIAGFHRVEAAKRLGWEEIPAHTLPGDARLHELAEIDENLIRNELSTLERGEHLARRKEIYEEMHPETKAGGDRRSEEFSKRNNSDLKPFVAATAEAIGVSPSTIQQEVKIAESLTEPVKEIIRDTPVADHKVDLLALSRIKEPEEQQAAAERLVKPHVANNSGDNEWYTPQEYIDGARVVMGGIDCDPASSEEANGVVGAATVFTVEQDGLQREWRGRVWLNPPYAGDLIGKFIEKLLVEYNAERVTEALVLVNNATETKWFQSMTLQAQAILFPMGRVRFWHPRKVSAPLQGQALIYFGENADIFQAKFKEMGFVCRLVR